jgi:hypothetical protein
VKERAAAPRRNPRLRLNLEALETRDQPAAFGFPTPGLVVGDAVLSNGHSRNSTYLAYGSRYGDLATVNTPSSSLSLASANANLRFTNYGFQSASLEFTSTAYADNAYKPAQAQVQTTSSGVNSGPGYITVTINPTSGDYYGKRVTVTLTATYRNTNITSTTGYNFVQVAYVTPAGSTGNVIYGTDYAEPPGGRVYRYSTQFTATVGSSFRIGMMAYSYARMTASSGADLTLDMKVQ